MTYVSFCELCVPSRPPQLAGNGGDDCCPGSIGAKGSVTKVHPLQVVLEKGYPPGDFFLAELSRGFLMFYLAFGLGASVPGIDYVQQCAGIWLAWVGAFGCISWHGMAWGHLLASYGMGCSSLASHDMGAFACISNGMRGICICIGMRYLAEKNTSSLVWV